MSDDLGRIARFVEGLALRERGILLGRVLAQVAAVAAAAVAALLLAYVASWDRAGVAFGVTLAGGLALWWWGVAPLLAGWSRAGDRLRQARLVESVDPDLGGRLVTSVERLSRPSPGESEAIMALVARRAASRLSGLPSQRIHPVRPVLGPMLLALASWVVLPLAAWLVPGGPGSAARWWLGGAVASGAMIDPTGAHDEATARVGDLVLRYRYPIYTGLEDKVVPNSTGEVEAPPGTTVEVTARSGDPVEAAGVEAYDQKLDAEVSEDRRDVTGRFDVRVEPGDYRLVLYRGGVAERSRAFPITPLADLPPDVTLDVGADGVVEVALDDSLPLQWRARDDYGVKSVSLQIDGADHGPPLYRMVDRRAEVFDLASVTPRELGLSPGDEASLRIAAWDNDTVSGSKAGYSAEVKVVVLGARGLDRRAAERQAELLARMIPVLARHLTDPWPPAETSGEMARWGEEVSSRYAPLFAAVEAAWDGILRDRHDALLMEQVTSKGSELIRYTQVAFEPGSADLPKEAAFEVTAGLREEAILSLEEAILAFHRMLRNRAFREIAELADDLEGAAEQLSALLEQPDPDALAMLAKLDQLEQLLEKMMQAAARLEDGGLREFVNQREGELSSLMDEVRKAIAEGNLEEARELMERLAEQIQQMGEGIDEEMTRRESEGEDAMDAAKELLDRLGQLEADQRALQEETRKLREEEGGAEAEKAAEFWERLQGLGDAHGESATAYRSGAEQADRPFWERSRVEGAQEDSIRLRDAIRARDLRGAGSGVDRAIAAWRGAEIALERTLAADPGAAGPQRREMAQLQQQLVQIRRILDQLESSQSQGSPEQQARAEQLRDQQKQLENELQQAREEAEGLEQDFPVKPQGMKEALEEAQQRMDDASGDLGQGRPMQAEGSQGVAAQRIKDAKDSLQRAMQQARDQASQGSSGGQGSESGEGNEGESEGSDKTGDGHNRQIELDIPSREEFRTPEEYRKALLEGMEGEVPEEFRAMKKRYYEELVHQ